MEFTKTKIIIIIIFIIASLAVFDDGAYCNYCERMRELSLEVERSVSFTERPAVFLLVTPT